MLLCDGWFRIEYKDIYVLLTPNGKKTHLVRLEDLNKDGTYNGNMNIVKSLLQHKPEGFDEGTIVVFPDGATQRLDGVNTYRFDFGRYEHSLRAVFASSSEIAYLPGTELETALQPVAGSGYKGYCIVLNLYTYIKKKCKRLYMAYF